MADSNVIIKYRPKVPTIFGVGAVAWLGEEVKGLGCKRPLCVYGYGTKAVGIAEKAEKSLKDAGMDYCSFDRVTPDPTSDIIDGIVLMAKAEGADCIIGIGGGSNMDAAKAVAIMMGLEGRTQDNLKLPPQFFRANVPIVLVPTTSGSGSEASNACVITHEQSGVKIPSIVESTLAIIDPELTRTLPASATAETGLDAFSHATEAITSRDWNPHVEMLALAAIRKIVRNLPIVCQDGNNIEARTEMAYASNWAGFATVDAPPHVGHGVADAFTQAFPLPHGLPCAWATSEVLHLVASAIPDKVKLIGEAMGLTFGKTDSPEEIGTKTAESFRKFMKIVGIKPPAGLGLNREDVIKYSQAVMPLSRKCPVDITPDLALKLIERVYDNYS
jgi:1,3-propanediol dehydrogenase